MTPAERVASDTWHRLGQAGAVGARLGEETLTDLVMLDMLPHRSMNGFSIHHETRAQEFKSGADVLLFVRYPGGYGRRLALQAKKLYGTGRYGALGSKGASGTRQIDKLDRFARRWGAVPGYLGFARKVTRRRQSRFRARRVRILPPLGEVARDAGLPNSE